MPFKRLLLLTGSKIISDFANLHVSLIFVAMGKLYGFIPILTIDTRPVPHPAFK